MIYSNFMMDGFRIDCDRLYVFHYALVARLSLCCIEQAGVFHSNDFCVWFCSFYFVLWTFCSCSTARLKVWPFIYLISCWWFDSSFCMVGFRPVRRPFSASCWWLISSSARPSKTQDAHVLDLKLPLSSSWLRHILCYASRAHAYVCCRKVLGCGVDQALEKQNCYFLFFLVIWNETKAMIDTSGYALFMLL